MTAWRRERASLARSRIMSRMIAAVAAIAATPMNQAWRRQCASTTGSLIDGLMTSG